MPWLPWSPLGCVAAFLAVLDVCQAHNPKDNPEYYVFRGDGRGPDEIREAGGFVPDPDAAIYTNPTTFSLDNHVNGRTGSSAYVSTSAEFGQAARNFAGPGNYVYRIHVTPNMIDVNAALTRGHPYPRQEEASALGGIPWTAVEGWLQLEDDREFPDEYELLDDDSAARLTGRYVAEFADQFEPNRAYDDRGLGGPARVTGTDPQVALLGAQPPDEARLINAATTFMNNHALAIGWTENQAFPYTPPTPPLSTEPVALPEADVASIPEAEREDLAEGRFDNLQCPALAVALGVTLLQPKGPNSKRYVLKSRDDKKEQCEQLRDIVSRLTSRKKPTTPAGKKTTVDLCGNGPLNPPCTTVEAFDDKCVAIPQGYQNTLSGVKAHEATSICRFYLEPDCKGRYFEADGQVVDLSTARPDFNDKVASLVCDTPKPHPALKRWQWSSSSHYRYCTRLDKVSLDFQLANNAGSGTYDKIKLAIDDAGQKVHVITEGPSADYKVSQDFNLRDMFGMDTVALSQIKRIRLLDELTDRTFGGDAWDLLGLKLRARCAGSGINIAMEKFSNLNKELQAHPTEPGRFQYNRDWEVWADDVKPQDWVAKPLCSHFQHMSVNLHVADANWAGTNNDIYAKVGEGSFLIARHPSRREVFTTDIEIDKAYKKKHVPVTNVASVGIESKGGHDAALPEMVTVYGVCSTTSTLLSVKQEITDWLYDGQTMTIKLPPENWVKA
ncbi:hypothetical protein H634G_09374 [Metarhizium anisopliae BRIP 53293]|uniref:Heat-labile enterotoxin IIA, A chain n=1 Tax=Metarhizium anisopliae BRIP 53293 TaxID=1291518 RepID=A0A0D9NN70_METAN|nr:hypothetical protein H634G_09374 [Metarhizium anisopliae BRIP 53293]KJK91771.1 hypothetical protein H633G_04387 [Metarhizium anisopliae BRIP 53284]